MSEDRRLIEDYLPLQAISVESSREKSVRKGHISTMHLWWARRPLVACRAAVYGALVPASQFAPNGGSDAQKKSLARANAAKFVKALCQYPGSPTVIKEAQTHILQAHADRLTLETGKPVAVDDIIAGRAPRPRVLDMFAGGGAIPLEALRLGCETYALDLNPVAHIIQLCTLVYPQKYSKPDPAARGVTGTQNAKGETTWGGLAAEVRYWGEWVLNKVKAEIGDLYPLIPDPEFTPPKKRKGVKDDDVFAEPQDVMGFATDPQQRLKARKGFLTPIAYLWTRTVKCKNPACGAFVPMVKQTWMCKKQDRYVALKPTAPKHQKHAQFKVVDVTTEAALGFDPADFSDGGNAACPWCRTVADDDYVKIEGLAKRIGQQLMAVVCASPTGDGKVYLSPDDVPEHCKPDESQINDRINELATKSGLAVPSEPIVDDGKNSFWCTLYGYKTWGEMFSRRQNLALLTFCAAIIDAQTEIHATTKDVEMAKALTTYLGLMLSRTANFSSTLCLWNYTGGRGVVHSFSHQAVPVTWDYPESNPFYDEAAGWPASLDSACDVMQMLPDRNPAKVLRGNSKALEVGDVQFDAVITDPPYYDNISYADLADFFYVWLKRSIGSLHPEHFTGSGTPKKSEIVSDSARHNGDKNAARSWFEENLRAAFLRANQLLRPSGCFVCVYAHKTTLGWATLVDALRLSGFEVAEAWPLATERKGGMKVDKAMLASSIFLVARKRSQSSSSGSFEDQVKTELEQIVRERVETLWDMGISGADLVIACVGAGLRPFTRFARVEYSNGEEVPAERFLTEVETVVLETILARLSKEVGGKGTSLAGLDPATRFYILWRYTYRAADLDAGEAIIFANGTHVELDGHSGLATGSNPVLEKKKSKYRLRDYTDRGDSDHLGLPDDSGTTPSAVDILHRLLWLLEHKAPQIPEFLAEAQPNLEQLRLVCQALAGPALRGGELADVSAGAEQSALGKLLANWSAVVEGQQVKADKQKGQERLL